MSNFAYKNNFLAEFRDLPPIRKERVFSISCFEPSQWEASPTWNLTLDELDEEIEDVLGILLEDWQIENIERRGQLSNVKNSFYHSDMLNQMLCTYLTSELGRKCTPESLTAAREFDVTVYTDDIPFCEIGIKRVATSSQICEYLLEHRDKVSSIGQGQYSMLTFYYPITESSTSHRVRDFVEGYERMSPNFDTFYESDNHMVASIPVTIHPNDSDIGALQETKELLIDYFDLRR